MCERKKYLEQICSFIEKDLVSPSGRAVELYMVGKIESYLKDKEDIAPDVCVVFQALHYACFMGMRTPGNTESPFQPMIKWPDGKNSGSVEDLPDQYVELYRELCVNDV